VKENSKNKLKLIKMPKYDKKTESKYEKDLQKAVNFFLYGEYRKAEPLFLKSHKYYKRKF